MRSYVVILLLFLPGYKKGDTEKLAETYCKYSIKAQDAC